MCLFEQWELRSVCFVLKLWALQAFPGHVPWKCSRAGCQNRHYRGANLPCRPCGKVPMSKQRRSKDKKALATASTASLSASTVTTPAHRPSDLQRLLLDMTLNWRKLPPRGHELKGLMNRPSLWHYTLAAAHGILEKVAICPQLPGSAAMHHVCAVLSLALSLSPGSPYPDPSATSTSLSACRKAFRSLLADAASSKVVALEAMWLQALAATGTA